MHPQASEALRGVCEALGRLSNQLLCNETRTAHDVIKLNGGVRLTHGQGSQLGAAISMIDQ